MPPRFPNYLYRHILESLSFVSFDNYFVNLCFYLVKISLGSCCHIIWIFPRQLFITFKVSPTFIIFLISTFIFILLLSLILFHMLFYIR